MNKIFTQLLIIIALLIVGCSDPCKDVLCGPGMCDDGTCICPDGYNGDACELLENETYFGSYNVTEFGCGSNEFLELKSVEIEADLLGGPFDVVLTLNFDFFFSEKFEGALINKNLKTSGTFEGLPLNLNGNFTDNNSFSGEIGAGILLNCDIKMNK